MNASVPTFNVGFAAVGAINTTLQWKSHSRSRIAFLVRFLWVCFAQGNEAYLILRDALRLLQVK